MFSIITSILTPIFTCVFIGFFWSKKGLSYDTNLITSLVTYFGTPCLIFYSLSSVELLPNTLLDIGLAALFANIAFIIIGALVLALFRLPHRVYLQSLSWPNVGNVGLPLCYFAFGEAGLALGVTFFCHLCCVSDDGRCRFCIRDFFAHGTFKNTYCPGYNTCSPLPVYRPADSRTLI